MTSPDRIYHDPEAVRVSANQIAKGIWVGNQAASQSADFINSAGITAIVNCTAHLPNKWEGQLPYFRIPVGDPGPDVDITDRNVHDMARALGDAVAWIWSHRQRGGTILIHCHAGMQRSAIVCAAYSAWKTCRWFYLTKAPVAPKNSEIYNDAVTRVHNMRGITFNAGSTVNFRPALMYYITTITGSPAMDVAATGVPMAGECPKPAITSRRIAVNHP